ncbi:MAG: M28 family peptidase [Blautia sp.]|jgi:hypothetical protein
MLEQLRSAFLEHVDIEYSVELARRMMKIKSNPKLGYRTAGSEAERKTGDLLAEEMRRIGLGKVKKDKISVDSWEFKKADLVFEDLQGKRQEICLGAYQTTFVTQGPEEFSLVYLGKGTAKDYEGMDVQGKIVLVDINQRDEWWINYPVYQAYLKGARALIAVQAGGYGEVDEEALNAQDICGPAEAPAFSISRKDAGRLKEVLAEKGTIPITMDVDSRVEKGCSSYNIVGKLPGKNKDRMILLSAHYDSYFDGFQDDNAAVAMMLGIAKAFVDMGYQPENTLVFCAMAAEEWGVVDSQYDWSTGAYEQVFTVHPGWRGKVIADLNFELPAVAHGPRDRVRSVYEYSKFLREFIDGLPPLCQAFPEGIGVAAPIETWSDDFSISIAGIPSMVNEFASGSFMETHYHSQFDNDDFYDEGVYRFHHEFYGLLAMAFDWTAVAPLDFSKVFRTLKKRINPQTCKETKAWGKTLGGSLADAVDMAKELYKDVQKINAEYGKLLDEGKRGKARRLYERTRPVEKALLAMFQLEQDAFVRLDWHNEVYFPQEIVENTLCYVDRAMEELRSGNITQALTALYHVDNNRYAFQFEEAVYAHFTVNVLQQLPDRLKWGAGRVRYHENLYGLVQRLLKRRSQHLEVPNIAQELETLKDIQRRQKAYYRKEIETLIETVDHMKRWMASCEEACHI